MKMTCNEANKISIVSFLQSLGFEPSRIVGKNFWYKSPLRNENTPSFKVSESNLWFDHGLGQGGKLVDLGILILNISVKDLLRRLDQNTFNYSFSFQKHAEQKRIIEIKIVKQLENELLIKYLFDRSILIPTAMLFCLEVHYTVNENRYFGIGFKNDKGGYEIRNPYFKGCIGAKSTSSIIANSKKVFLFEGFIDFLTAFQEGLISSSDSFIILNSVNQINSAILKLEEHAIESVSAYFDNDQAGRECFRVLQSKYPYAIDLSKLYDGYNDLNEMFAKK